MSESNVAELNPVADEEKTEATEYQRTQRIDTEFDGTTVNFISRVRVGDDWEDQETSSFDAKELKAVAGKLAVMGMAEILRRASNKEPFENKLAAMQKRFNELKEGKDPLERKTPTGPRYTKASKMAAIAVMYGVTTNTVKEKFKDLPEDKVEALLNDPKVLAKVDEMRAAAKAFQV